MTNLILMAALALGPGYKATLNKIDIEVGTIRTSPRAKAEGTEEWILKWGTKVKCDYVKIDILYKLEGNLVTSTVYAAGNTTLDMHNPILKYPSMDSVVAIRFTLRFKGKEVSKVEFH